MFLLLCELAAQLGAKHLNRDRMHIHELPAIAKRLHESAGPKILILGNSLSLHGVSSEIMQTQMKADGIHDATVEFAVPVGTDSMDWLYLYRRYFLNPELIPDVVVIGYVRHHVVDLVPPKRIRRLGRHFLDVVDAKKMFNDSVPKFETQVELLLSNLSAAYGDQPEYRDLALGEVLPNFSKSERRINKVLEDKQIALVGDVTTGKKFEHIEDLAKILKATGTHGIFIPMALPEPWETDPEVEQIITELGMTYLDARNLESLTPEDFPDGYHMGERAKELYSRFLGKHVVSQLKNSTLLKKK
ncbi:MAG: hypothetical protein ACI97A_003287 [Planctomycetota bacterium]|jgi:hypothetical protein